jgi:GWxTD domain-containing protein
MTAFDLFLQGAQAKALGWTLLHSLWEGAAIAVALAVVLGLARSARVRYSAACLAMIALVAASVVTYSRLSPERHTGRMILPLPDAISQPLGDSPVIRSPWEVSDLLPWLAPFWMAGVLAFQLRCLASWLAAGRMRRVGVCRAPSVWEHKTDELRARLRITRTVTLLESCFADVPVVIGYFRPMILMPVALLTSLPAGQMEAILLHELAHIRRGDYLVNLMQTFVEGLLFYHPAVWWISHVIRVERENCCDDVVVATSGDAHEYATALAALAEIRWGVREPALAATGGNLVKRIRRLLAQPEGPRSGAPIILAGIFVVTGAVAMAAWQAPQQDGPAIVPVIRVPAAPILMARAQDSQSRANSIPVPYQRWLDEEAVYIITDEERKAFLSLTTDEERTMFINQFWARRDPAYPKAASPEQYPTIPKGNPDNAFRKEIYRRIAYANDRFKSSIPGWKTDRGRIYIQYGPPDEIESHPSGGKYNRPPEEGGGTVETYPFEQWMYRFIEGIGTNIVIEFVDKAGTGEYRLTKDPKEKEVAGLPMKVQVAYTPLTPTSVLTVITVQLDTRDLRFTASTATVNIFGRLLTMARRPIAPFEDVVKVAQSASENPYRIYQKSMPLQPGQYRLNIAAKDPASGNAGTYEMVLDVPQSAR